MKIPLKQYWELFQKYLRPQWKIVSLLSVFLLGNITITLINPQIIRNFIDAAQIGAQKKVLVLAALVFLGFAIAQQIFTVLGSYFGEIVAWTATNSLRIDLTDHCLRLDLSFHNSHSPGEMIERLDGDINNLANFFSRFVIELMGNSILMIGVLVLMWRENWLIGIGLTIFVLISMFVMLRYRNVAVPYWRAERQASADFYGFLEERLAGTEDIRANGAESYTLRKFHWLIREMLRKSLKSAMVINVIININQFLYTAGTAAAFAIAAYLFGGKMITIGSVYLVYHYTTMINRPMENIAHQIDELQRAGAGIVRIQELLGIKNIIKDYPLNFFPIQIEKRQRIGIEFNKVDFGYKDSIPQKGSTLDNGSGEVTETSKEIILRNISFSLEAGKVLGILGRTGSGKTTLTRLLFRFYDPDKGGIFFQFGENPEVIDIRHIPVEILRQQVGMVTQNIQLFNATVRDNLTFFDKKISDSQIFNVLIELGLEGWLSGLPAGLETILESGEGGLSAGQAQLLAFTRIFLSNPGLVILDEASSRLDPATDMFIESAVNKLVTNRTAIIIAHRLKTVMKADQIMILEKGQIIEFGDRLELMGNPFSKFSLLLKTGLEEVLA